MAFSVEGNEIRVVLCMRFRMCFLFMFYMGLWCVFAFLFLMFRASSLRRLHYRRTLKGGYQGG